MDVSTIRHQLYSATERCRRQGTGLHRLVTMMIWFGPLMQEHLVTTNRTCDKRKNPSEKDPIRLCISHTPPTKLRPCIRHQGYRESSPEKASAFPAVETSRNRRRRPQLVVSRGLRYRRARGRSKCTPGRSYADRGQSKRRRNNDRLFYSKNSVSASLLAATHGSSGGQ